jgi:hypothetical protein
MSFTRLTFSSSSNNFNRRINDLLITKENNEYLRLGDILRRAKNNYNVDQYIMSFCLLGDPAVMLNYPANDIVTNAINGNPVSAIPDTLEPGQQLSISGEIHDDSGNIVNNFNGNIIITIFDQITVHHTLANDVTSSVMPFTCWDDTIISNSFPVINGQFNATVTLPWNLDSATGIGRISYYAENGTTDASGCHENIIFRNLTAGIEEPSDLQIVVYPNPSSGKINIKLSGNDAAGIRFSLWDAAGKLVFTRTDINSKIFSIDKHFSAGQYIYEVSKKNKLLKQGKLQVEN